MQSIVIINDVKFKSRRNLDWEQVEEYLKEYIEKLVQIATNRAETEDYDKKHGNRAKSGWYRYDTRFGLPVYNDAGELERYNTYFALGAGICVSITAANTSPQPINSFVDKYSFNIIQPARVANTDSKLISREATAGARCFCPIIWKV